MDLGTMVMGQAEVELRVASEQKALRGTGMDFQVFRDRLPKGGLLGFLCTWRSRSGKRPWQGSHRRMAWCSLGGKRIGSIHAASVPCRRPRRGCQHKEECPGWSTLCCAEMAGSYMGAWRRTLTSSISSCCLR